MKCADVMSTNPETCLPGEPVLAALHLMRRGNVGAVPVVASREAMRAVGMVTDRDIALELGERDVRPSDLRCGDVMSAPSVAVPASAELDEAIVEMRERQLRRILVEDHGRLVGIISQADLARHRPQDAAKVVEDISKAA